MYITDMITLKYYVLQVFSVQLPLPLTNYQTFMQNMITGNQINLLKYTVT